MPKREDSAEIFIDINLGRVMCMIRSPLYFNNYPTFYFEIHLLKFNNFLQIYLSSSGKD